MKYQSLALLLVLGLVSGACGKLNDAIDSTIAIGPKLDKTNQGMDQTNAAVERTNEGMDKTNTGIHRQTLATGYDDLIKDESTKYVSLGSVTPTSMMIPGKILAEEATQEEIVELTYTILLEINVAQPDTSMADPTTGIYPKVVQAAADLDKWRKFTALQVIAGMAPQATIDDMIEQQITEGGRYEETAYNVLYLRHFFIKTYLLDNTLMTEKMTDPGMFNEALKQVSYLKSIEKAPYAKDVNVVLYGYFDADLNKMQWNLNGCDVTKDYYPQLKSNLSELEAKYKTNGDSKIQILMTSIKQQINDGLAGR